MSAIGTPGTPSLILGTAGHIDHGKSSLIQALTGIDPDRLAEEKRRGITIELGFAQLTLPDGRAMGVVDVPGHERFVKQMIAGATGIDVALMCIAADDGVMPQTIEHLHVLELLGIRSMVVALTKTDLVDDEWVEFVADEVRSRLKGTPFASAPIVPVSAQSGTGFVELKDAIAAACRTTDNVHGSSNGPARLPIDRAFTIKGSGTVVTGTLWSGRVSVDDDLELLPEGRHVRVRGVQEHGKPVEVATPGSRTALNLAGIGTDEVHPGMLLASPNAIEPTDRFDAWLAFLGSAKNDAPLESGTSVRVAHGTAEVPGRVLLMDGESKLEPGASTLAQIRLDAPLPVSRSDRFIIRSFSPVEVIGGGEALLCHPRRRTKLADAERSMLDALKEHDDLRAIDAASKLERLFSARTIASRTGVAESDCSNRLKHLEAVGVLAGLPTSRGDLVLYALPQTASSLCSSVENALMKFHTMNPDRTGVGKTELLHLVDKGLESSQLDAIIERLRKEGRALVDGGEVSHPKAGAGARKREQEAAEALRSSLVEAGITPPTIDALAEQLDIPKQLVHRALNILDENDSARRIGDYCFSVPAIEQASEIVTRYLAAHGSATATELKDALGITRKHAIPLLEYMDAHGITRREGDARKLPS